MLSVWREELRVYRDKDVAKEENALHRRGRQHLILSPEASSAYNGTFAEESPEFTHVVLYNKVKIKTTHKGRHKTVYFKTT